MGDIEKITTPPLATGRPDRSERPDLAARLEQSEARLAEQARIFVPLVALALLAAMPIWAKSLNRFLKLLASPFVLLPIGFCIVHLAISWRRIVKMRQQIRRNERMNEEARKNTDGEP